MLAKPTSETAIASRHVLVLIGPPGAGKTTVARLAAERVRAGWVEVNRYRDRDTPASVIADDLAANASERPLVFECSGASDDFEHILHELAKRNITCVVAGLWVSAGVAIARLTSRRPYTPPKGGRWNEHVHWTLARLRLVPTDLDVDMERSDPVEAATIIMAAWRSLAETPPEAAEASEFVRDRWSLTQLATRQVCPREYAYRYVWRAAPSIENQPNFAVGQAVHEAIAWLFRPGTGPRELAELLDVYDVRVVQARQKERGHGGADSAQRRDAWAHELLSSFFWRHYEVEARHETLAVEADISMALDNATSLTGRLDRLSRSSTGDLEVTEFKLRRPGLESRPRIPDLLQPATYAIAAMAAHRAPRAFFRLHVLEGDKVERQFLTEMDAPKIRLALLRWIHALRRRGYEARSGHHCLRCPYNGVCPAGQRELATNGLSPVA